MPGSHYDRPGPVRRGPHRGRDRRPPPPPGGGAATAWPASSPGGRMPGATWASWRMRSISWRTLRTKSPGATSVSRSTESQRRSLGPGRPPRGPGRASGRPGPAQPEPALVGPQVAGQGAEALASRSATSRCRGGRASSLGPAGLEGERRRPPRPARPGRARRTARPQGLGHQQIRLVVDAGQGGPAAVSRQPSTKPRPPSTASRRSSWAASETEPGGGLPLGEGGGQQAVGRLPRPPPDQVDGQVVGGAEGRAQVGRRGDGRAGPPRRRCGRPTTGRRRGPTCRCPAARPGRSAAGTPPTVSAEVSAAPELGEPLDHHGAGRHVDAQRQRLGGEDHLQQPGGEALLHRLAEGRDQPGVVGRHPASRAADHGP